MISDLIINLREDYINQYKLIDYQEINCGLCPEFAEELLHLLGGLSEVSRSICCDELMMGEAGEKDENDIWDTELLTKYWSINPPPDTTWQELNNMNIGYHVWIFYKGKHYDCECPDGVNNFFDLPFFRRWINNYKSGEWRYD